MSKQRVFSREYTANYADYNKYINGTEILKTVKQTDPEVVIDRFVNYQQFQTLSNAYFAQEGEVKQAVTNLYDSNGSFLIKSPSPEEPCKLPYLYPYGEVVTNKSVQPWFPTPLYMKKWCSHKKPLPDIRPPPMPPIPRTTTPSSCSCSGKIKPLFI